VESYVLDSTKGGRLKSVPYEIGITPVWYNSDLFAQAGVSEFPATWDAFMDAADKLKANGIVPGSQMTGGSNAWTSMLWFSHIMGSLGGPDVWSKPLTDPVYVEGAEYLKQLYADGNTTRDAVGGDAGVSGGTIWPAIPPHSSTVPGTSAVSGVTHPKFMPPPSWPTLLRWVTITAIRSASCSPTSLPATPTAPVAGPPS
jgi:hypothetical protein